MCAPKPGLQEVQPPRMPPASEEQARKGTMSGGNMEGTDAVIAPAEIGKEKAKSNPEKGRPSSNADAQPRIPGPVPTPSASKAPSRGHSNQDAYEGGVRRIKTEAFSSRSPPSRRQAQATPHAFTGSSTASASGFSGAAPTYSSSRTRNNAAETQFYDGSATLPGNNQSADARRFCEVECSHCVSIAMGSNRYFMPRKASRREDIGLEPQEVRAGEGGGQRKRKHVEVDRGGDSDGSRGEREEREEPGGRNRSG